MHGCDTGSIFLVNAEVDSMGGVVDGGAGFPKTSPRRAAIEKVQTELRQEYGVREERKKELEFLEKGGNPLDFKLGHTGSLSVQSTSLTDQHLDQFVTSEVKGSFALTASPHGDSVESSGRPGASLVSEPNCADNLMLFNGENEFLEGNRNSGHPSKNDIALPTESSQVDSKQNGTLGHSVAFGIPRKAYKRRHRSRPNRDGTRSSSTDVLARGGHGCHLPSQPGPREIKGPASDAEISLKISMNNNSSLMSPNDGTVCKTAPSDCQMVMKLDGTKAIDSATYFTNGGCASENLDSRSILPLDISQKPVIEMATGGPEPGNRRDEGISEGLQSHQYPEKAKVEDQAVLCQMNGFSSSKGGAGSMPSDDRHNNVKAGANGVDSESSCTHSLDGSNEGETFANIRNIDSNGIIKEQSLVPEVIPAIESEVKGKKEAKADEGHTDIIDECNSIRENCEENGFVTGVPKASDGSGSCSKIQAKNETSIEVTDAVASTASETEKKPTLPLTDCSNSLGENAPTVRQQVAIDSSVPALPETRYSGMVSNAVPELQTSGSNVKSAVRVDEDAVLEEARVIEAKRKRVAELSAASFCLERRRKSHWEYVLEEMTWLANDFAQERLWKLNAAAQICHRVAFASRLRFQKQNFLREQRKVSSTLAKYVAEFWQKAEEIGKTLNKGCSQENSSHAVLGYAVKFLKYNCLDVSRSQAEAPVTPDRISDPGALDSWDDHLTEENLFYSVPAGAIETYRKSIECHVLQWERTGSGLPEEAETSTCDAAAEFEYQDIAYEADEAETSAYDMSVAFEDNKSSTPLPKKRKSLPTAIGDRAYEVGVDLPFMSMEKKDGTQQSIVIGRRPHSSLNVLIPTKRHRTAPRQRVLGPFTVGTSGGIQATIKTDVSSGDTSSFQDDQSTLHGGSHLPNSFEVQSTGDFERQLPYGSVEVSAKPSKKKTAKHLVAYEQKWQVESNFQNEQRDYSKRRSESHQVEPNGNGLHGQHMSKKPKTTRQLENSFDNMTPIGGAVPSPVASQMSNMSNSNKFMKLIGGRDRGRKSKGSKISAGQAGSRSAWSLFEDQALVVLVHDMGMNWELVSDAINSTLQFKCIYRNPKECKERHKILMDGTGDGADSAEDSESSQPYRSTLPGIPKGSARQLFQRLQGPMEEDMLKSHFGKIIMIGQKHRHRRTQVDNLDRKQVQQPHSSHMLALSQVCPNNLNGGPILTPLDLCDIPASSPDSLSHGYQGPHTSGLAISKQGNLASTHPTSGTNSPVQGSPSMTPGNNFALSSSPLNASVRDGRYAVPRSTPLSVEEQHRMQYSQMSSGRNIQQSNIPAHPGADRGGVRVLPGGGAVGVMPGINRSMPMARPGFQGIASSSMLNSGSLLSSGMMVGPSHVNMPTGAGPVQGASMLRPRNALHMTRPNQVQEPQRQMAPELHMQVSQGNCPGIASFSGLNSSFPNQTASPPVPSYPPHHPQSHSVPSQQPHMLNPRPHLQGTNHVTNSQQQAYAIHLTKEGQLQQRFLQQQQQFVASNSLMPQPQIPVSSLQNSTQISQQVSASMSVSPLTTTTAMTSVSQHQLKHLPHHGLARGAQSGSSSNQMGKQRQRQPQQQLQQAGRLHPQQRHQSQAKLLKGVGRGNMMIHQNSQIDSSLLNGLSTNPGNPSVDKGEQAMHLMQPRGLYSGSATNPVQPVNPSVPPHSLSHPQLQQKIYSQASPSTELQHMSSHCDNHHQGHGPTIASGPILPLHHQPARPMVSASSNHQKSQLHPQILVHPCPSLVNQNKSTVQRVLHQSHQVNSDPSNKSQASDSQSGQHRLSNSSQTDAATSMPKEYNNATSMTEVASPSSAPPRETSEPLIDSARTPPTNSAGSEPATEISQGRRLSQASASLSSMVNDVNVQWHKQHSLLLQGPSSPQRQQVLQQQLLSPQHSQQQGQLLQAGNSSLSAKPSDSRLD